jgi:hypothetical protein
MSKKKPRKKLEDAEKKANEGNQNQKGKCC